MPRNILETTLPLKFPADFFWGSATCAHQVEGGKNRPGLSNWGDWEVSSQRADELSKQGKISNADDMAGFVSGVCCDFRGRFRQDFEMAKSFGQNAIRIGVDWAEVEPASGKFDRDQIKRYGNTIRAAKENGLEPIVTLFHWTHPAWFENTGGWKRPDAAQLFARYSAAMLEEIGRQVTYWTILNEPNVYSYFSFEWGLFPPQERNAENCAKVLAQLVQAHRLTHPMIKSINPNAKIGIAQSVGWNEADTEAEKTKMDRWNYDFVDQIRDLLDFAGINLYHHNVHVDGKEYNGFEGCDRCVDDPVVSDFNWGMCPRALAEVAKEFWQRYQLPVMVTEHGHAVAELEDRRRSWYLWESLKWLKQVMDEGVPVLGYLHWSTMDNLEWAEGFHKQFGLWYVERDPKKPNFLARIPRRTAYLYRDIIRAGGLNAELAETYAKEIARPTKASLGIPKV